MTGVWHEVMPKGNIQHIPVETNDNGSVLIAAVDMNGNVAQGGSVDRGCRDLRRHNRITGRSLRS